MSEQITLKTLMPLLVAVVGVLVVLWAVFLLAKRAIRKLADRMKEDNRERFEEIERWAAQLTGFIRHFIEFVAGLAAVFILLRGLGVRGVPQITWEQVTSWLLGPGVRIIFVMGGAFVISRVLHLLIGRLPVFVVPREGPLAEVAERSKRAETISRLLSTVTTILIMSAAALIVLREFGVDITPILTGAGIAGLAVGFGAQHVVRDIISGFFLILENQIRVGDVARINGLGGLVEDIRLRTVQLRGLDGTVHVIPNGAINEISNMTKDFSFYVIDLGVAYKENTDHVVDVVKEVSAGLRQDPEYAPFILEDLEVLGVDDFGNSAVVIKVRIKTVPLKQWFVGREMRRRIKHAFDERGIEIPFPHLSVYVGEKSKPFAVQVMEKAAGKA
jgi:small conductance mechanosensitive channel